MTEMKLCENCNLPDRNGRIVTIVLGENRKDGSIVQFASEFRHWLCEKCGDLIARLDFKEFTTRHENRPRTLELP